MKIISSRSIYEERPVQTVPEPPRQEKKPEKPKVKRRRIALAIALTAVVLCLALLLGTALVEQRETIFPRVSVMGTRVSGMTVEEAAAALESSGWDGADATVLRLKLPGNQETEVRSGTVGWTLSAEDAAQAAWDYGRSADRPFTNFLRYVSTALFGRDVGEELRGEPDADALRQQVADAVDAANQAVTSGVVDESEEAPVLRLYKGGELLTQNADEVYAAVLESLANHARGLSCSVIPAADAVAEYLDLQALHDERCGPPQNAYYDVELGDVADGKPGLEFDAVQAQALWDAADLGAAVEIPVTVTPPAFTKADVPGLYADLLAIKSTSLGGSSANRVNNVTLAAQKIDGVLLMPGETFSYNDTVGQRTYEAGFREAAAYADGEVVQELGGGICQVSSTLYYCALLANLNITARTNHYFTVGYIEPGMDATVSWGGPEFMFVNDRTFPICLHAYVDGGNLTVEIWGTDVDGSTVRMSYYSSDLHVATYRHVYDRDGNLLYEFQEATSVYHTHN